MPGVVKILNDLQNLFFPRTCICCQRLTQHRDQWCCVQCAHQLPLTRYTGIQGNSTEKIFFGRVEVAHATSLLWFHKGGITQKLIHQLKYGGQTAAGTCLGNWLGMEMVSSGRITPVDLVLPIPLHPKKFRKRGYNQVSCFARAIADQLQTEFREDLLRRTDLSASITGLNRADRTGEEIIKFEAPREIGKYGHVLLADDVVTTGATLESAAKALLKAGCDKVSIATIAITE